MARRSRRVRRQYSATTQSSTGGDSLGSEAVEAAIHSLESPDAEPKSPIEDDDRGRAELPVSVRTGDTIANSGMDNNEKDDITGDSRSSFGPSDEVAGLGAATGDENSSSTIGALSLSPIAASREVRINRAMGQSLGMTVAENGSVNEVMTGSGPLDYAGAAAAAGVAKALDEDQAAHSNSRESDQSPSEQEKELFSDDEEMDESLERDDEIEEPDLFARGRFSILSPVIESCSEDRQFETPESPWDESMQASTVEQEEEEVLSNEMNDSVATSGSSREDEIARTQEELGATSLAFLHRLRGAAFLRKKRLVHCRDDMVAKERSHRQDIEAARLQRRQSEPYMASDVRHETQQQHVDEEQYDQPYTFKARSVQNLQLSGSLGVPKVEKRPATVPRSPLLGFRRTLKPAEYPKAEAPDTALTAAKFKARHLPKSTGEKGSGGQSGLPKITKRRATEPVSPLLGPRRQAEDTGRCEHVVEATSGRPPTAKSGFKALPLPKSLRGNGISGIPRVQSKRTTIAKSPLLGIRRKSVPPMQTMPDDVSLLSQSGSSSAPSSPVGVKLLSTPVADENLPAVGAAATGALDEAVHHHHHGYEPHSTARARKRAEFDEYLVVREKERRAEESRRRQAQVETLKRELAGLRKEL